MSLWTPDGEIPVDRSGRSTQPEPRPEAQSSVGAEGLAAVEGIDLDSLSPEERLQLEEAMAQMAQVQEQIAATPVAQLVANHVMGFYELAAIKLSVQPPQLAEAKVAIDAMAATVDAVGDRLGEDAMALREALMTIQTAFVELSGRGTDA